jgi:hypothetical protein
MYDSCLTFTQMLSSVSVPTLSAFVRWCSQWEIYSFQISYKIFMGNILYLPKRKTPLNIRWPLTKKHDAEKMLFYIFISYSWYKCVKMINTWKHVIYSKPLISVINWFLKNVKDMEVLNPILKWQFIPKKSYNWASKSLFGYISTKIYTSLITTYWTDTYRYV